MVLWSPGMTLDDMERQVIEAAFKFHRQNKTATAAALGISVRTLDNKLEKYAGDDVAQKAAEAERLEQRANDLARQRGVVQQTSLVSAASPSAPPVTDAVKAATADMPKPPPPAAKAKPAPRADDDLEDLLATRGRGR